MSLLYLIRHGQASFMSENYDVLSDLGAQQSRLAGAWCAQRWPNLDKLYTGPCQRQIDTAKNFVEAAREAGADFPDAEPLDALDEYPAFSILKRCLPQLQKEDPEFRKRFVEGGSNGDFRKNFQRVFEYVLDLWIADALDLGGLERYEDFVERVRGGLDEMMSGAAAGERIAATTSGGPISATMRLVLGTDAKTMMQLGAMVVNASITEITFNSKKRMTLSGFNAYPYLSDPETVTYR